MDSLKKEMNGLQNLFLPRVKFLDEKVDEFRNHLSAEFKSQQSLIDDLKLKMRDLSDEIGEASKNGRSQSKQLRDHGQSLERLPDKELLKRHLDRFQERVDKTLADYNAGISSLYEEMSGLRKEQKDTATYFQEIYSEIQDLKNSVSKNGSNLEQSKLHLNKRREADQAGVQELKSQLEKMGSEMDSFLKDNFKALDQVALMGDRLKSDQRRDRLDFSKEKDQFFSALLEKVESEISSSKGDRKSIRVDLDRLEHEALQAMRSGKAGKEMEDFIKQVSYNAKQIARIQKHLDGEV